MQNALNYNFIEQAINKKPDILRLAFQIIVLELLDILTIEIKKNKHGNNQSIKLSRTFWP